MKTKFFNALSLAVIMAMLFTSLALADSVTNDVVSVPASITLTAGDVSSYVDVQFWIQPNSNDGDPQCNFDTSSEQLTFTINAPYGVTAIPSALTFNKCKDGGNLNAQTVRFSASSSAVTGNISFTTDSNNSGGSFNYSNAVFYINITTPPPSDTTPPVITPIVNGTLGNNGWYVSDVTVSWAVNDSESGIASSNGCDTSYVTSDTAGQTFTCSATNGANLSSSQSVTIMRDATAPTVTGQASPAANGAGWNNAGVNVTFSCSDSLSGIASCGPDQTLSGDGANQSATGVATDMAGNSTSATVSDINIDMTAPTIYGVASPAANSNGWNNADVTVTFTCNDGLSGVVSCGPNQTLTGEGVGQFATGTTLDNAGNVASATVNNINIDKTAPTASASASPAANEFGWNNTDVTVSFDGFDGLSGLDFCDAPVMLSSEGSGQSASGTCTDKAGNVSAPAAASGINIDKTPPTITWFGGPQDGASYYFGFVPEEPVISMSDALSGPLNYLYEGSANSVGTNTIKVTAYDKAGNSYSESRTYTVLAWTLNGFYQPVDMNGVFNTVKGGSTVPLKFEIFAGPMELTNTSYIQSLQAFITPCSASGSEDPIEILATGGTSLRYDAVAGQFIYNWQTPKKPGTCYRVIMVTKDGSKLEAFFKLK